MAVVRKPTSPECCHSQEVSRQGLPRSKVLRLCCAWCQPPTVLFRYREPTCRNKLLFSCATRSEEKLSIRRGASTCQTLVVELSPVNQRTYHVVLQVASANIQLGDKKKQPSTCISSTSNKRNRQRKLECQWKTATCVFFVRLLVKVIIWTFGNF